MENKFIDFKIFDSLLEPTFVINERLEVIYANETAGLICDISNRKLVRSKSKINEIFRFSEPVTAFEDLASVTDTSPYQEVSFKTDEGKSGKVQITLQPVHHSDKAWLIFVRDVTLEETLQKKYRRELEQKEDVIKDLQVAQAELEKYSKNLEQMVAERTAELKKLNTTLSALLDSLGQGFFVFNTDGDCLPVSSKACLNTVETNPENQKIWDVLKVKPEKVPGFQKWMTTVFMEMLPFEDLAPLAPDVFPHSQNKHIRLEYFPMRSAEGQLEGVVVVSSDQTDLVMAQRQAESEKAHVQMILKILQHKKETANFLREAQSLFLETDLALKQPELNVDEVFRCLHTLKGGAASFSIQSVAEPCHHAESLLSEYKAAEDKHIYLDKMRQEFEKSKIGFESFLSVVEQVLGHRDRWTQRWIEKPVSVVQSFAELIQESSLRLQFIENFATEPVFEYLKSYQEAAQDVADRSGKYLAPINWEGTELKILPEVYSALLSTLVHAYRNAVDHGIEAPDTRRERAKPDQGSLHTKVELFKHPEHQNLWMRILIKDDGNGIDPQKIRAKMEKQGLPDSHLDDLQVIQQVFASQFSTKEQATDISGRGVGLDAILYQAKQLGGTAFVTSELTKGTSLFIEVPWFAEWLKPHNQTLKKSA